METTHQQHLDNLRRKAEQHLNAVMASLPDKSSIDVQALLHDLQVHQIELTLQNEELRHAHAELEAVSRTQYAVLYRQYANLYEFAPVGYCSLDEAGSILKVNLTAVKQLGIDRAALLHTHLYQYIVEEDRDTCFTHLRAAFNSGSRQTCELRLRKQDGTLFWASLESIVVPAGPERFSAPSPDAEASTANPSPQCLTTITDISDRKHADELLTIALRDKEMLIHETLHRTKNNMGTIISLLHLLALRHPENTLMIGIFQEIEQRIRAMLLVQRKLYQSSDCAQIDLKEYLDELIPDVFHNLAINKVGLRLETDAVRVSPDTAITCGLLLNELLTNTLKYAFPPSRDGLPEQTDEVCVALQRLDANTLELRVSDNGVGLPPDFDLNRQVSMGLTLVTAFVQQLHGTFELSGEHGTQWRIRFPHRV